MTTLQAARLGVALLCLVCCGCVREPEIEVLTDIEYGSAGGEKPLLDLARPKGLTAPVPAIVCIHGGGWRGGDRHGWTEEMKHLAAAGYVAVTIEYRLVPKHVFPAQVEDCKCAVRWLRAHASEYQIDPNRIGAMGDSAGGHLSMMLGALDPQDGLEGDGGWSDQSSKVQAVVAYYGPTNFNAPYPNATNDILREFLGDPDADAERYRLASPLTYVNAGDAPMLLFHGTHDELVPHTQATEMGVALAQAGVGGRVELMLGARHGWGGAERARTSRAALQFFASVLRK